MKSFHHVSLLTKDRKKNLFFYIDVLGLRFVKNTVNQENHRMLHYYYGDYSGSPGSVVTFFIVPHLGHRYDTEHFLATIGLKLPKDSLSYWQDRFDQLKIAYTKNGRQLSVVDPDHVEVLLTETDLPPLALEKQVQNQVPGNKQILGLMSSQIHVKEPQKTTDFFHTFLGWKTVDQKIQLNATDFIAILPSTSEEKSRMGRGSMDHIALAVANEAELNQLYKRAQQQGWKIEELISRGYFKSLYIREPGGNRIEFATITPGFTIDEPLEHLGETLALPPFLAEEREEIETHLYPEDN